MSLKRSEVDPTRTWDLSSVFPDFDAWDASFATLPSEASVSSHIERHFRGQLGNGAATILAALAHREAVLRPLERLYIFAQLKNAEDLGDARSSEAGAKIGLRYAELAASFSYLEPELLGLPDLAQQAKDPALAAYRFELEELLRGKAHVLSEAEESLLAQLSPVLGKFGEIHEKWADVDLEFPDAVDAHGTKHAVTQARAGLHMESPDRVLRKSAFESLNKTMAKGRNAICANFNGAITAGSLLARVKRFPGFLESQLFPDDVPVALYDTLVATVRRNAPLLHRSMEIRRKALGLAKIAYYDRAVSLARDPLPAFTWEQGKELVLKSLEPLGAEYVAAATAGLGAERWCDFAENQGKSSGAFSSGTYDTRPYMLMTWTGSLNDVFTLAHELGHSMHSRLSNQAQPYHLSGYAIFVAEVASTLNEALLGHYILTKMPGTDLARHAVSSQIRGFEGTVVRQVLFAAFERACAKLTDAGEALTPDRCDAIYMNLNREWYGPEVDLPEEMASGWMSIPHFYHTFYVYKYATSYCASLSLFRSLLAEGEPARARVLGMLRAGGSKAPLAILRDAGVDFLAGSPVDDAFHAFAAQLDAAESLFIQGREDSRVH